MAIFQKNKWQEPGEFRLGLSYCSFTFLWAEGIPAYILTGECGLPVDGENELVKGFFNQHVQKREIQVRLFFKSKTKRRVQQVEADA